MVANEQRSVKRLPLIVSQEFGEFATDSVESAITHAIVDTTQIRDEASYRRCGIPQRCISLEDHSNEL